MASSGEDPLPGLQEAAILPCPHLAKRRSSLVTKTLTLLYQGLTLMTSFTRNYFLTDCIQLQAHWGLRLQPESSLPQEVRGRAFHTAEQGSRGARRRPESLGDVPHGPRLTC